MQTFQMAGQQFAVIEEGQPTTGLPSTAKFLGDLTPVLGGMAPEIKAAMQAASIPVNVAYGLYYLPA